MCSSNWFWFKPNKRNESRIMIALKNTTNNQIFYIIHRKMDGEQGWDLMPLNVEYTENGQYSVVPPSGFDGFSSVNVTVDVDQSACNLTTSTVNITEGGEHTITPPEGYDGFSEVVVNVETDCGTCYDEGVADQKSKLTSTTFTQNGNYTREDGWNAVQVNVDTVTPYNNGKADGVAEQKAKLTSLNVTQNGTYRREDGYNEVVVSVPSGGSCEECRQAGIVEQKSKIVPITITTNGTYTKEDGYSPVTVNVDTVTPYNNGYNDGYGDGETDQKAKLDTLYVTHNGTYSREDGWDYVDVNVDCGSYVDVLELDKHKIDVMNSVYDFPPEGLTYQVTLYSSCDWDITGTPWWASVDQIAGSAGMYIININITDFMDNTSGYIQFENDCGLTDYLLINLIDYKTQPLTLKVTHSGCLYWKQYGVAYSRPLEYSLNGENYRTIYSVQQNYGCLVECLSAGDVIKFRSIPTDQQSTDSYSYFVFTNGLKGELYGNLNSFFSPNHSLGSYGCIRLFKDCVGIESAENLYIPAVASHYCQGLFSGCTTLRKAPTVLPATTLASGCYQGMFDGCTSLTTVPELPAIRTANSCYSGMFSGCSSLTKAPALPATTLSTECYKAMFKNCTALTESPFLPATTLQQSCYNDMFYGCTSLSKITAMMDTQPSATYTASWVYNVAPNGTFIKNSQASWANTFGSNAIPTGWTVTTI